MFENPGSQKVTLKNIPRVSEHDVDRTFNEMRIAFVPHITEFVANHDFFSEAQHIEIEFAQTGVSSIIAILETESGKWVLKIPRSATFSAGEGAVLKAWEAVEVTVPHVIDEGLLNGQPYTLMEHIDAPTLASKYSQNEMLERGVFHEMGTILRQMHSVTAEGYGFFVDGHAEFTTAEDWLAGADMQKRFEYIDKHKLFQETKTTLENALEIITGHSRTTPSTYCHDDYGPHNMFATSPITIFDANPKFNSPYYELGRIRFADLAYADAFDASQQLLDAYFGDEKVDTTVLNAFTYLALCMKCPYWHKTGRTEQLKKAEQFFVCG
jgi:hypothetical protein